MKIKEATKTSMVIELNYQELLDIADGLIAYKGMLIKDANKNINVDSNIKTIERIDKFMGECTKQSHEMDIEYEDDFEECKEEKE